MEVRSLPDPRRSPRGGSDVRHALLHRRQVERHSPVKRDIAGSIPAGAADAVLEGPRASAREVPRGRLVARSSRGQDPGLSHREGEFDSPTGHFVFGMKPNGRAPRLGRGSCWFDSSRPDRPGLAVRRGCWPVTVAVAQPSRAAETPTPPPLPGSGRPAWVTLISRSRVRIPSATPRFVRPRPRGALGETSEKEETLERGPP